MEGNWQKLYQNQLGSGTSSEPPVEPNFHNHFENFLQIFENSLKIFEKLF